MTFNFATDSVAGTIEADNWEAAKSTLHDMIPEEAIEDGAWGWIESPETGERYTIGTQE